MVAIVALYGCASMCQEGALTSAREEMQSGRYNLALDKLAYAESFGEVSPEMATEISVLRAQCYDSMDRKISESVVTQIDFKWREWKDRSFSVSPDIKRVAYVAKAGDKEFAVVDGKEGKQYDDVYGLTFSPDSKRVAYWAKAGGKQFAVVDGKEGKQYDEIGIVCYFDLFAVVFTHSFTFSPDSKRVAYWAKAGDKEFAVVDGKEGKQYGLMYFLTFSPDSKRVAYVAKAGLKYLVVVDGKEGKLYDPKDCL